MKIALSTQPETYNQLISRSLKLYRASFSHVFFLALTLSIIAFIPRLMTLMIGQDIFSNIPLTSRSNLWLILIDLGSLILFTAILWRTRCIVTDAHESILDDMKIALRKLPHIFIATLLQMLLIFTINFLFAVGMVYFVVHHQPFITFELKDQFFTCSMILAQVGIILFLTVEFCFFLPIILVENKGVLTSLVKSSSLVWRNWWRTLLLQVTPWLAYLLTLMVLKFGAKINFHIYFVQAGEQQSLWVTGIHILIFALFIPWVASVMLVQLRDLELRKNLGVKHSAHVTATL